MNTRLARIAWALALLAAPALGLAEVSVDRPAEGGVVPFFEPSPAGPWTVVRTGIPAGDVLNAGGDGTGDGWPVVLRNVGNGRVEAVWSSGGENREILRAYHDGSAWSASENLSAQVGVDHLPSASTDGAGNLFVAWERERNGRHAVFFTATSDVGDRVAVVEVTDRSRRGRRPALVLHDDDVWIGSEELSNASDGTVKVVLDRISVMRDSVGHVVDGGEDTIDIARHVCTSTQLAQPGAVVQLHSELGHLWMDWIDAAGVVGWVQQVGESWTDAAYEPFDPAAGDAAARLAVREQVLGL